MATINNMASLMFAPETNRITVSNPTDVAVRIKVTTRDNVVRYDQASTYTPVSGVIEFGDLGDLINKCILLTSDLKSPFGLSTIYPYATLQITAGSTTSTATVYYCTAGNATGVSQFCIFPTQLRKRKVLADQQYCMVWLPQLTALAGASVTVVGTYVSGSTQSTATYTTSITGTSGAFTLLNLTPARVKSLCGISSSATLYEYTANIWINGVLYDSIQFTIDRRNYPQHAEMLFLNTFGLPESVMLRGREEESHSLEAEFGYNGWLLCRLDDETVRDFRSNTGWLSKAECRQYGELYRSPVTAKKEELGLRRVVIREIDVAYNTPSNEPRSFDVTWRYADRREEWFADLDPNTAGHNIFDSTFAITFD